MNLIYVRVYMPSIKIKYLHRKIKTHNSIQHKINLQRKIPSTTKHNCKIQAMLPQLTWEPRISLTETAFQIIVMEICVHCV